MDKSLVKQILKSTNIWNWDDLMSVLEYINSRGCTWSEEEKDLTRLSAADCIDRVTLSDFGPILEIYGKYHDRQAYQILPQESNWTFLREFAIPVREPKWADERDRRMWNDPEAGSDAVYSERICKMKGCEADVRLNNLIETVDHYFYCKHIRSLLFLTDRPFLHQFFLHSLVNYIPGRELCLKKIIVTPATDEVGLVFSSTDPSAKNIRIITGDYPGGRLSIHETVTSAEEARRWL